MAFLKYAGIDDVIAPRAPAAVGEQLEALGRWSAGCDELDITWLESDIDVDGGKIYLTAGAPASPGDDEERMLRALRAILDAGLRPACARASTAARSSRATSARAPAARTRSWATR